MGTKITKMVQDLQINQISRRHRYPTSNSKPYQLFNAEYKIDF